MVDDPNENLVSKGMAKFYLSIDLLVSRNLLGFPKFEKVEDLSWIFQEKIKNVIEKFFSRDFEELRTRKTERILNFERDFAETGCLSKFLTEIDDEIQISNQDNFDQSQKNPREISIFDQRSVIAFSENEVSPQPYHENIGYPLV